MHRCPHPPPPLDYAAVDALTPLLLAGSTMPLKRARNSEDARPKKKPKRAAPDESEDEEEIDEELLGKFAGRRGLTQEEEEERVLREMAREAGKVEAAETASVMASERAMSEAAASLRPSQRGSQKGSVTSVASSFKQLTSGKWEDLPLPPSIKKALTERFKFEHMTQVAHRRGCMPAALLPPRRRPPSPRIIRHKNDTDRMR